MSKSYVGVFHEDTVWAAEKDLQFGAKLHKAAMDLNGRPAKPEAIRAGVRVTALSWMLGSDTSEATQVYVVTEHSGRRVLPDQPTRQADLDALVEVLLGHGYTCRRTTGQR